MSEQKELKTFSEIYTDEVENGNVSYEKETTREEKWEIINYETNAFHKDRKAKEHKEGDFIVVRNDLPDGQKFKTHIDSKTNEEINGKYFVLKSKMLGKYIVQGVYGDILIDEDQIDYVKTLEKKKPIYRKIENYIDTCGILCFSINELILVYELYAKDRIENKKSKEYLTNCFEARKVKSEYYDNKYVCYFELVSEEEQIRFPYLAPACVKDIEVLAIDFIGVNALIEKMNKDSYLFEEMMNKESNRKKSKLMFFKIVTFIFACLFGSMFIWELGKFVNYAENGSFDIISLGHAISNLFLCVICLIVKIENNG